MALPHGQRRDRTALVLYGSETGNSQDVAEDLGRMAERLHFVTRVTAVDHVEIVRRPQFLEKPTSSCNRTLEYSLSIYPGHICRFNNWTRRVPEKCQKILEKSFEEAFASRLFESREVHNFRSW